MQNNFFSNKISLDTGGKFFNFGSSPVADWKIILTTALVVTIIGVAVNTYIFIKIDKGEIFVVEDPAPGGRNTLNVIELRKTVEYYQAKATKFESILNTSTSTLGADPSI